MLDVIIGEKTNTVAADDLVQRLEPLDLEGTLYIGYPILASFDEATTIDALLTTLETGLVVFDLNAVSVNAVDETILVRRQDDLFSAVHQKLMASRELRRGRELSVNITIVTIDPSLSRVRKDGVLAAPPDQIASVLTELSPISSDQLRSINASIQRVSTMKPPRRRAGVSRAGSRGAVMKEIEKQTANLDHWQKVAAIESPDGPQRIRGLAGSGKTVVLALKAAYLHARNPEWEIAITFHTRSLYQQFKDLIRRFSFEHSRNEPDWTKLHILHAWGSSREPGVYAEIASRAGLPIRNFMYARDQFGYNRALEGVCDELRNALLETPSAPLYDVVLIDEAQDLPQSFFEICYLATKEPHRIVFAYDELQNLSSYSMVPPAELFGRRPDGSPRVPDLANESGRARRDIILPVCYRNTPWALTIAHGIGFGIYRQGTMVQFFDDTQLWKEIGYEVVAGEFRAGTRVSLRRRADASPDYFRQLVSPADAVSTHIFEDENAQAEWVAAAIQKNLTEDELEIRDILVILPEAITAKREAVAVRRALQSRGLDSHLAGVTSSVDELFDDQSIAISGIYRAKGNEAPMVYVLNSQYAVPALELIKRRNSLFTAITRSRAWVRLCGVGSGMTQLIEEVDKVREHDYQLEFSVPTPPELAQLRRIHRDITQTEKAAIRDVEEKMMNLLELIESGELPPEALPESLRAKIRELLSDDGDHS